MNRFRDEEYSSEFMNDMHVYFFYNNHIISYSSCVCDYTYNNNNNNPEYFSGWWGSLVIKAFAVSLPHVGTKPKDDAQFWYCCNSAKTGLEPFSLIMSVHVSDIRIIVEKLECFSFDSVGLTHLVASQGEAVIWLGSLPHYWRHLLEMNPLIINCFQR